MIDLHMHSRYSDDGELMPARLVEMCAAAGIGVMSVTDHNTVRANGEAAEAAAALGIVYVPGAEFDCTFEGVNFHVLGYGIDWENSDFRKIEEQIDSQSVQVSAQMLENTKNIGFAVSREELEAVSEDCFWKGRYTGEMFAEVLLHKEEYADHPLLTPYRPGGDRSNNPYVNFYWDFYSQGKPCHVPMVYPKMEEIIAVIHRSGGYAVLAHPAINLKTRTELLPKIAALGIDGIEVYSSYHTAEQTAYYREAAVSLGKFMTCGSDFHGKTKPAIRLGGHGAPKGLTGIPFIK